jgi:DNA-binding YbaB/EbfC family protein
MAMGGGFNAGMMKQVQKMQQDMLKAQEDLQTKEFTATSGGGAVSAVCNGKHELVSLRIKPEAVDPEDVEMLEDLVLSAVNESLRQASEFSEREMSRFTGGLNLPF